MTSTMSEGPGSPLGRPGGHAKSKGESAWDRISLAVQLLLSLGVALGALAYLLLAGSKNPAPDDDKRPTPSEPLVQLVGPKQIRVKAGTPLAEKLQITTVEAGWLEAPVLPVTGMTLASLRPGKQNAQDAWQFATPDLLSAYADWQKAVKDVQFQETQLKAIRELNEAKVEAQKKLVARMERLVKAGTDTEKDLVAEKTNLIQFEIQGRKDVHDQEQAVFVAKRSEATLARQLQQAGLDPAMLSSGAAEGDIVVAEVPERVVERVRIGMLCAVRFVALPDRVFSGKVTSMAPVIMKDKRVLNVQFMVKDPQYVIRPGMFAEIGLGTDKRQALLMPADGALHVGDSDYALVGDEQGAWHITEIQIGALRGSDVEVLTGLKAGNRVLGKGAILLKPVVARALQTTTPVPVAAKGGDVGGGKR
jgi:hypothetical protein